MSDAVAGQPAEQLMEEPPVSIQNRRKEKAPHRRYGFACSSCRKRKAKCSGEFPSCNACTLRRERCSYEKPSVAYTVAIQNQLKAYQARFEELRNASTSEREFLLDQPVIANNPGRSLSRDSPMDEEIIENDRDKAPEERLNELPAGSIDPYSEASVDSTGRVCFYGPTSLYHVEPQSEDTLELSVETHNQIDEPGFPKTDFPAAPIGSAENFIASEISSDLQNELLGVYWCFPHHFHLVLCKSVFLRDLPVLGHYATPFLLSTVLAQAARYSDHPDATQVGNHFASRALQLLPKEIDRGSSFTAIQGLLILSSRECACGRISQGWLFSGIAFRMMRDLGLHVSQKKLGPLARQYTKEHLSLRQQLFWSCYTWDKSMSLCLGRAPIIHDYIEIPTPDCLVDGRETDQEPWKPPSEERHGPPGLITQPTLSAARFAAYCELYVIVSDILDMLYLRPRNTQRPQLLGYLDTTLQKLRNWSSKLPDGLLIQHETGAATCPPSHILLLNLVHQATIILLCRPYQSVCTRAMELCIKSAKMIDTLFTMHMRRFGFRYLTYLQSYTLFVACTINVVDLYENRAPSSAASAGQTSVTGAKFDKQLADEASSRLAFGLKMLRQAWSTPSAARSANVLEHLLQRTFHSPRSSTMEDMPEADRQDGYVSHSTPSPADNAQRRVVGAEADTEKRVALAHAAKDTDGEDRQNLAFPYHSCSAYATSMGPMVENSRMDAPVGDANNLGPLGSLISEMPDSSATYYPRSEDLTGAVETPMHWLTENMHDDGSWMLMMDIGSHNAPVTDYWIAPESGND